MSLKKISDNGYTQCRQIQILPSKCNQTEWTPFCCQLFLLPLIDKQGYPPLWCHWCWSHLHSYTELQLLVQHHCCATGRVPGGHELHPHWNSVPQIKDRMGINKLLPMANGAARALAVYSTLQLLQRWCLVTIIFTMVYAYHIWALHVIFTLYIIIT